MKKLLIFIMCLAFIPTLPTAIVSAEDAISIDEAIAVFEYLDIYTMPENGISDSQMMSRGDFATLVAKAFKLSESGENTYFADVTRTDANVTGINALTEAGVVNGYARLFRPDETITLDEALKILISVTDYRTAAEEMGGYPAGYFKAANRLGIIRNYNDANGLTYKEALDLLYSTLTAPALELKSVETDEDKNYTNYTKSDETILTSLWDLYLAKGKLTSCYTASVDGTTVAKDEVVISGEIYDCLGGKNYEDCIFGTIDYVYARRENENSLIVYLTETTKAKDVLSVSAEDLVNFDGSSYTMTYMAANGGTKSKTIARNTKIYYNGSLYTDSLTDVMNELITGGRKGTVTVKSDNSDGEAVFIKSYEGMVVAQSDVETNVFYNMTKPNENINLNEYENVYIVNSAGEETNLSVAATTVLSVAASKDKTHLEIVVCNDVMNGTVNQISDKDGYKLIKIGEKEAKLDNSYSEQFIAITNGGSYTLYLDQFGYVIYAQTTTKSDYKMGLLEKCYVNEYEEKFNGLSIYVSGDKEPKIYPFAERVKLDGEIYKGDEKALKILYNIPETEGIVMTDGKLDYKKSVPTVKRQVIRFKLDDNENITEIDTTNLGEKEDKDSTLSLISNAYNFQKYRARWTSGTMRFGSDILYNAGTTVTFAVPSINSSGNLLDSNSKQVTVNGNPVKGDYSMYSSKFSIEDNIVYDVVGYKCTPDSMLADALVINYSAVEVSCKTYIFDSIGEKLNEDNDVVKVANMWDQAVLKEFELKDVSVIDGIKKGDLVRLAMGTIDNKVYAYELVYDYENDVFVNSGTVRKDSTSVSGDSEVFTPSFWWTGSITTSNTTGKATDVPYGIFQASKGKALDKIGTALFWDWDGDYGNYEECMDLRDSVSVVIIDRSKKNTKNMIMKGTIADIPTYKQTNSAAADIVYVSRYWIPQCIYAYIN